VAPALLPGAPGYALGAAGSASPSAPRTAFDRTHLGRKGAEVFARMVERELVQALPTLRPEFAE
jgi:hypothetical protein